MSSRLRSLNSTKISFFAFQDIITCVSGILILITLILATELDRPTSRMTHDADPELERKLSETLRRQAEVDAQNRNLQELLAAAETAPATEKLETDITRLRAQLTEEKKKHASVAEQLTASRGVIEARDRMLGLTDLKAQIQRVTQEAESLAREEAKVRDEMARLDQRAASVQSKLLKLHEREGKLWLIPDKSFTTKEPILATISGSGAKVERFDHPDQAKEFITRTGADSLAVAVGSVHAMQSADAELDIERIAAIHRAVNTPLVLHGSSGVKSDSIVAAIENGICKINVATYLNQAFVDGLREMIGKLPDDPDYRKHLGKAREYVKERVREKIRLFRSNGRVDSTGGFASPKTFHRSADIGRPE